MGILDTAKTIFDISSGAAAVSGGAGSIFEQIMGNKKTNPEVAQKALDLKEVAKKGRESVFGEISKSLLLRQFPRLAAISDLAQAATKTKTPERVSWQNNFETFSALALFLPEFLKHFVTDRFASSSVFQALVKYWPGLDGADVLGLGPSGPLSKSLPILGEGGSLRDRILNRQPPDPNAVILAIRIMHQDIFVTGKMSFETFKQVIDSPASALNLLGGAGAVAMAAKAISGGSSDLKTEAAAATGGVMETVKKFIGLDSGSTGKKILDLNNANPAAEKTTMQKNILALLEKLGVKDTATLKQGTWEGNNDQVTVEFSINDGKYYLIFDNDTTGTDIKVNNAEGQEIANFTDWATFDADDNAQAIFQAIAEKPSKTAALPANPTSAPTPANDNAKPADKNQKAA